jgi:hypothetical protein
MPSFDGSLAPPLAMVRDVALGGKPGQRHRHSPSFTNGRGGIGGGVGNVQTFGAELEMQSPSVRRK